LKPAVVAVLVGSILVLPLGCGVILGLHEKQLGDPDASATDDAASADGSTLDGALLADGASAEGSPDAPPSDCTFDPAGYGDIHAAGCWSTFDLTQASAGVASAPGSEGVAFDGRYMYLAPAPGAIVLRYDTTAPFSAAASWASFDVKAKLGFQPRFSGAMFDGRWVTFVPRDVSPLVVRFDTTLPFADAASWSTFDPTPLDANAIGFAGATFDGKFSYFVPRDHSIVLRHDTQAGLPFGWEKFDVAAVQSTALTAFWGGVYDGKSVYMAPEGDGVVVRYETAKPFDAPTSWSRFDTVVFHPLHFTLEGGVFDGRYVYMGPGGSESFVVRCDTQGTFTDAASWAAFDMGQLSVSLGLFSGAAFDGRFVYFTPLGTTNGQPNRLMGRYDITAPFDAQASWSIVDMTPFGAGPVGGAAYDGRFVYFMPDRGRTKVARFEARRTAKKLALPAFYGSTF
jgi:hypothetical protein